jgi:hypothetical protein
MNLEDYYRDLVHINDTGGGWGSTHYGVFSRIIRENNYKVVAEIGAGYGTHSKYILKNNPTIEKLYIIDPMQWYADDSFAADIMKQIPKVKGENFNELYELINKELSPWNAKYSWIRKLSGEVTNEDIPDNSLDAIFIDGDHSYEAVFKDLTTYWNKVRVGGQLLGDDVWMSQVERAVMDFVNFKGLSVDFLTRDDNNYRVYRIRKI